MTWETGRQGGSHFPAAVRAHVRRRDNDECQLRYPGCTGYYEQIDHKVNVASTGVPRRAANNPDDLQCVCRSCHNVKTSREAVAGRRRGRAAARRQPEPPPGLRW